MVVNEVNGKRQRGNFMDSIICTICDKEIQGQTVKMKTEIGTLHAHPHCAEFNWNWAYPKDIKNKLKI